MKALMLGAVKHVLRVLGYGLLDDAVYAATATSPGNVINRFSRGSLSDPARWNPFYSFLERHALQFLELG